MHIGIDATTEVASRLMDANDEELAETAANAALRVTDVEGVSDVRARWLGHEVEIRLAVELQRHLSLSEVHAITEAVRRGVHARVPDSRSIPVLAHPKSPTSSVPSATARSPTRSKRSKDRTARAAG